MSGVLFVLRCGNSYWGIENTFFHAPHVQGVIKYKAHELDQAVTKLRSKGYVIEVVPFEGEGLNGKATINKPNQEASREHE